MRHATLCGMSEYVILVHPSANRVYAASSPALLRAELAVFGTALAAELSGIEDVELGGVGYVRFTSSAPLGERDLALLSNLSSLYALFELDGDVLRPVKVTPLAKADSDLLTIQKYAGKTNESFTKLLLNITLLATADPASDRPRYLLDPLCGRGTTLNHAIMYGLHATGLDVDAKDFEAYEAFIKTWLRNKRVKHTAESGVLRRNKARLGRRLDIEYAFTKEDYKAGETRKLVYFNADTLTTDEVLRANSADVIVTDAPYGVQHGNHRDTGLQRSRATCWPRRSRCGPASSSPAARSASPGTPPCCRAKSWSRSWRRPASTSAKAGRMKSSPTGWTKPSCATSS